MGIKFDDESAAYRRARDQLLTDEVALRRQMEAVARSRRALPPGPVVRQDYTFQGVRADGSAGAVRLSELFRSGTDTLVLYNYMFPRHRSDDRQAAAQGETARLPRAEQPCPSCTALLDQLDAAVPHFEAGGGNFAAVANTALDRLLGVARDRGWRHLRLLSSSGNGFKRAYHAEDADGQQLPLLTVFKREPDGILRLTWASELLFAESDPGQDPRATGTIEPFWNLFDLGPNGRPQTFNEELQYPCCH